VYAANIQMINGSYRFDVLMQYWELKDVVLNMGGLHNIENMIAAISVAHYLEIDNDKIREAVADFRGVKRRFEYIVKNDKHIYIDDYAHHPDELKALINGAKLLFPEKKCNVVFQPHLFSRTRDFADGFAEALNMADEVYLLPIYPARELPMEGVTSEMLADLMDEGKAICVSKEELMGILDDRKLYGDELDLLITAGAGDIDTLVEPIKNIIIRKQS
ncbi:MAG: cyanophycin synthetase, partial [Ferruginibacter sp.]